MCRKVSAPRLCSPNVAQANLLQHLCSNVAHMLGLVRDESKPHTHSVHAHSKMIENMGSFPFSLVWMAPKAERLHELRDSFGCTLAVLRSGNLAIRTWDDQKVVDVRQGAIAV